MKLGSVLVTRESIMDFARVWDAQPFHLSDEAAAASPLKKLSASGWQTLALIAELLEKNGTPFTGAQSVKWVRPLFPDMEHVALLEDASVKLNDPQGNLVCEVVL
ncbi:MAG: MaoC/PaaZ C-terminal domain-containing protein [Aestuariivirgaceae bacterium]|nr:MaoC/PaaZ C-terminal domain-containing protein [Aestuariivirgaceae bacterium]